MQSKMKGLRMARSIRLLMMTSGGKKVAHFLQETVPWLSSIRIHSLEMCT